MATAARPLHLCTGYRLSSSQLFDLCRQDKTNILAVSHSVSSSKWYTTRLSNCTSYPPFPLVLIWRLESRQEELALKQKGDGERVLLVFALQGTDSFDRAMALKALDHARVQKASSNGTPEPAAAASSSTSAPEELTEESDVKGKGKAPASAES